MGLGNKGNPGKGRQVGRETCHEQMSCGRWGSDGSRFFSGEMGPHGSAWIGGNGLIIGKELASGKL